MDSMTCAHSSTIESYYVLEVRHIYLPFGMYHHRVQKNAMSSTSTKQSDIRSYNMTRKVTVLQSLHSFNFSSSRDVQTQTLYSVFLTVKI